MEVISIYISFSYNLFSNNMERKIDRFDKYIKYKHLNDNKVTVECSFSVGTLGKSRGKGRDLSARSIEVLLTKFKDLNRIWLLTGEGNMISNTAKKEKEELLINKGNEVNKEIPLIPFAAVSSAFNGDISVAKGECERYIIPTFKDADFLISVRGNSMEPLFFSGDIIACKIIKESRSWFQHKKAYVLDTTQGALIQYVTLSKDKTCISIISENKSYPSQDVPIESIRNVAIVLGVIRTF